MLGLVLFVIVVPSVLFYALVYYKWSYKKKFVFKTVLVYLGLAVTVFNLWLNIASMEMIASDVKENQLPARMDLVTYAVEKNDYDTLLLNLKVDKDYEKDFEPYWERMIMYESCLRYRIFSAAEEAGMGEEFARKAEYYGTMLLEHCENPAYTENIPYGKYFLELAGNVLTNP